MTAQYPTASGDGQDATGASAADLSYADVASPPAAAQPPDEQAPAAEEWSQQPSAGVVRSYSWPSASPLAPAESSEVDSVGPAAIGADIDVESATEGRLSTVDQGGTVAGPGPSIVDDRESGSAGMNEESAAMPVAAQAEPVGVQAESAATPAEPAAPQVEAEEPEPTDPAVTRMRAVQGRLGELDELPIEEHPARYEELHAELAGALAQIDRAPDSQA
ncbi:MAG TPA: hypothetical protein VHX59_01525 [Mycobacteriales bacterium]|nr:hypothetical protein [Mycobacteriales bacterium]